MSLGPLIAIQSESHLPHGLVPAPLLVEAAAEAGYRAAALVDRHSLGSVPSFLAACKARGIQPIVGMTTNLAFDLESSRDARDVFDLVPEDLRDGPSTSDETVTLLAEEWAGFKNLVALLDTIRGRKRENLPIETLMEFSEGLHLVLGPPGSAFERVISGRRPWRNALHLERLLDLFPRSRTCFGGIYSGPDERELGLRLSRLEKLPKKVPPLAVHWAAYRNDRERFWGAAKRTLFPSPTPYEIESPLMVEHPEGIQVALQGLSSALSRVEKLAVGGKEIERLFSSTPPIYPSPRGTDTHSFFWTITQEIAISTGHINRSEYKDRLYEEFQYFKQTEWPTLFLLLWDLRRRVGLPPGTLRPSGAWIGASLFAHLLGLSRVDPVRAELPFQPTSLSPKPDNSLSLEVECPHGWESNLLTAAESLLGETRAALISGPPGDSIIQLERAGARILPKWEDLGFSGNRPETPPAPPRYLTEQKSELRDGTCLHLSGRAIAFRSDSEESGRVQFTIGNRMALGGFNLNLRPKPSLTLACATRYRGLPETSPPVNSNQESVTEWIEKKTGRVFYGKPYLDDTGHFEALRKSASLIRLATLPESVGYRPLLWKWIIESTPNRLEDLANYLTLAHHWSFWGARPGLRRKAAIRPLEKKSGAPPPWWDLWETFLKRTELDSRIAARIGSHLEEETQSTGGWILYRDSLTQSMTRALDWPAQTVHRFLSPEEEWEETGPFTSNFREAFLDFLGHPNPLPDRAESLKKAAETLACMDAFESDPAAWAVLAGFLHSGEIEERRSIYRLLRSEGFGLRVPPNSRGIAFPRSSEPATLEAGLTDLYGIGPQIAAELASEIPQRGIHDLFSRSFSDRKDLSFPTWLNQHEHHLNLTIVEMLIRLGYFNDSNEERERKIEMARSKYHRRTLSASSLQQTLFQLDSSSDPRTDPLQGRPHEELDERSQIDWELYGLRLPLSGSPLENFRGEIPNDWIDSESDPLRKSGLLVGWSYDLEVFSIPRHGADADTPLDRPGISAFFLLHTNRGDCVIEDEEGRVLSLLPEDFLPEPRLDGHRIHLREPLKLVVNAAPRTTPNDCMPPLFRLSSAETIDEILTRQSSWATIRVRIKDPKTPLIEDIQKLADWFHLDFGEPSTELEVSIPDSLNPLTLIKRRSKVFPSRRVVASEVLVDRLRQTPGVESVEVIPRQAPLFKTFKNREK
ncbi:MAG: PHP domain-containing protein [Candidatus Omnitrophica bacterium]|nr:PHP domain-containing protein [Candidatus Omnitrophota bacterium]